MLQVSLGLVKESADDLKGAHKNPVNSLSLNDVEFVRRPPPPPPTMAGEDAPDPSEALQASSRAFVSHRL